MNTQIQDKEGDIFNVSQTYIKMHCYDLPKFYRESSHPLRVSGETIKFFIEGHSNFISLLYECFIIEVKYLFFILSINENDFNLPRILNLQLPHSIPTFAITTFYIVTAGIGTYDAFSTLASGVSKEHFYSIWKRLSHSNISVGDYEGGTAFAELSQSLSRLTVDSSIHDISQQIYRVALIDAADIMHFVDIGVLMTANKKVSDLFMVNNKGDIIIKIDVSTPAVDIIIDMLLLVYRGMLFYNLSEAELDSAVHEVYVGLKFLGIYSNWNYQVSKFIDTWE